MTFKRTAYDFFGTGYDFSDRWVEAPPATSRHTRRSLRLLPSGPDRVHELVLREDQQGLHRFFVSLRERDGLSAMAGVIAIAQPQIPGRLPIYYPNLPNFTQLLALIALLLGLPAGTPRVKRRPAPIARQPRSDWAPQTKARAPG